MSTIAITSFNPWCIDYHRTMAATLEACLAVKRGTGIFLLTRDFWLVSRDFRALLAELNSVTRIPPSELPAAILRLEELHKSVNRTLDLAAKKRRMFTTR